MSDSVVEVEKKGGVAIVTLNRPNAMNALSTDLMRAFFSIFRELKEDSDIGVAILTGAGRAFCAGLDLKELADGGNLFGGSSGSGVEADVTVPIKEFGRPVIGAINGVAITGGFELALACDILIASTEARFADTHARVGVIPGSGLSQKLSRTIGIYRAKEVSFTGNFIAADQAAAWGLVNRVVEPAELLPTCLQMAEDILSCPGEMIRTYKQLIDDGFQKSFGEGLQLEAETHLDHFKTVEAGNIAQSRRDVQNRGRKQQG